MCIHARSHMHVIPNGFKLILPRCQSVFDGVYSVNEQSYMQSREAHSRFNDKLLGVKGVEQN